MPQGLIVKALSGYYFVWTGEGEPLIRCRARGVFKKRGTSPLVGDRVMVDLTDNGEGTVTEISKRSSELIRPPVANVDQAVLVFSVEEPALNLQLLDKFLVQTENADIDAVICFSKMDLLNKGKDKHKEAQNIPEIQQIYEKIGYAVIPLSSVRQSGLERVKEHLDGHISVFSGQSGVGKSSLLNAVVPGIRLETNEISSKLGRGKHTTRHVELIPLSSGGWVADTPGFSQLDFLQLEPEALGYCFREFRPFAEQCKFRGCLHRNEPGCKVLEAKENGTVSASRHEHYLTFLQEIKDRKPRY